MPGFIDRTGKRYGRWLVLSFGEARISPIGNKRFYWLCRCDCGNERLVEGATLQNGLSQSCGCRRRKPHETRLELSGKVFGRLTEIGYDRTSQGASYWKCVCECGNEVVVRGKHLKKGSIKSCGCLLQDSAFYNPYYFEGTNIAIIKSKALSSANTSGIKGVFFDKAKGKWVGNICCQGKSFRKNFASKEAAAAWRAKKEDELFKQ